MHRASVRAAEQRAAEEERGGRGGERNDEELNDVDSDEGTGFAAASERVQNHLPLRGGEVSESLDLLLEQIKALNDIICGLRGRIAAI